MLKQIHDILLYWDHVAWFYCNTQWHNAFFDNIFPYLRNQWFWTPLYFFLLLFMTSRFGRRGWAWCAFFLLSFIITDQLTATLLKPIFHRVRPCNNPMLSGFIHLLVPCGGGYSFPSSHAANHFSIGVFSAVSLARYSRWLWPAALLWAASIAFAQVYVGVHFPMDVAVGGLIGFCTGIFTGWVFTRYIGLEGNGVELKKPLP